MPYYKPRIYALFTLPLYTSTGVYREEDLDALGIGEALDDYSEREATKVISNARRLAATKPELALHFFRVLSRLHDPIQEAQLAKWVTEVLDIYDARGLRQAITWMLDFERHYEDSVRAAEQVLLQDIHGILLNYLHGLGQHEIKLAEGTTHYTDTLIIYLPARITRFNERAANFLLYKIMVTHKFAQLRLGTYDPDCNQACRIQRKPSCRDCQQNDCRAKTHLSGLLRVFSNSRLARDLFMLVDTARIEAWMNRTLPGLHRDLTGLKKATAHQRTKSPHLPPKSVLVEALIQSWLGHTSIPTNEGPWSDEATRAADLLRKAACNGMDLRNVAETLSALYRIVEDVPGPYQPVEPIPYVGELMLSEVERTLGIKGQPEPAESSASSAQVAEEHPDFAQAFVDDTRRERNALQENPGDLNHTPHHLDYEDKPGFRILEGFPDADNRGEYDPTCLTEKKDLPGTSLQRFEDDLHVLDEWDYRRQSYRKGWVLLKELEVPTGDPGFAEDLLVKYQSVARRIRHQFERIRFKEVLLRRQKEGDEVDLDAVVEAFSHVRVGRQPSENLYMSLNRSERDVAAAFLIDLSGSTKGLTNFIERAALLVMCEALKPLRDRFAIYGFSGQTRRGCRIFRIKGLYEQYGEKVKSRIANLHAAQCTRLGPPIRYLSALLNRCDAKSKLLITLSDGRPYDYDGYIGEYAIEDTRQSIIEAKQTGILPFCVTIDETERGVLSRMYGPHNYVIVDDVRQLPHKIPYIYNRISR